MAQFRIICLRVRWVAGVADASRTGVPIARDDRIVHHRLRDWAQIVIRCDDTLIIEPAGWAVDLLLRDPRGKRAVVLGQRLDEELLALLMHSSELT